MLSNLKSRSLTSVSALTTAVVAALAATTASAQAIQNDASKGSSEGAETVGEVVVTGSRVIRDGFNAPTPTTVFSQETIERAAQPNIADVVNQLPQLQGSSTPATGNANIAIGAGGQNLLNLRQLGVQRTLVLIDGRRVVPTTGLGSTDANNLPSQLVQRVDVVTGGASAAYGSDAVAGVVNFVLDSKFAGFKGDINAGTSSREDNTQAGIELTFGAPFAGGRGHILLSAGYHDAQGVPGIDPNTRRWYKGILQIANPAFISRTATPNVPALITAVDVNNALSAPGGLITAGPLRGTSFGPGGVVTPFQYGNPVVGALMVGGQGIAGDTLEEIWLVQAVRNANQFARVQYEVTDDLTVYGQVITGYSRAYEQGNNTVRYFGNLTMRADNPYIPASVRNALAAAGATTFSYGINSPDLGRYEQINIRETRQFTAGVRGKAFGDWSWDAYYQDGKTDLKNVVAHNQNLARFAASIDVITGPNGQPVCRSFAANPTCVPMNIFGTGVTTRQNRDYITGTTQTNIELKQRVAEASISGQPFSTWAGPVSVVAGLGYRKESIATPFVDPIALANGWQTANYKPANGKYDVKEAFGETVIPLLKDAALAQSLEFNGAVRLTDYSTSGRVTTWKAGLNYRPFNDLLLRGTRSRDIRAPGLLDLYAGGNTNPQPGNIDPKYGNLTITSFINTAAGNPNLNPEVSDSLGVGAVFQPSWLTGFSISVDYYNIKIEDGISTLPTQNLINDCFSGARPDYCAFVKRGPGFVGGVLQPETVVATISAPVNLAAFKATGLDIEASYRRELSDWFPGWDASLAVRTLATHVIHNSQDNGIGVVHETAGENGGNNAGGAAPHWRVNTELVYAQGPLTVSGNWRYISSGVLFTSFFDTSAAPLTVDKNDVPAVSYFDLGGSYRFTVGGRDLEAYARVNNLFDKAPPITATPNVFRGQFNPTLYDVIGRYYVLGLRFRM